MRAGLESLTQQEPHLQRDGKAVFTVTGAEMLLRVKLNPQDEQSELDKFFGYLQWTREGLREFRYPIVLWVTHRILLELSRRSADFWSWRKAVLRFMAESPQVIQSTAIESPPLRSIEDNSNTEPLPPLAELQAEIAELTANDPNAIGLATLYDRLGQVYAQRIGRGIAENLEQERDHAINAFQQAITRYQTENNQSAEVWTFVRLGSFFNSQSRYLEAIKCYRKSLGIAQSIKDLYSEAASLIDLGNSYNSLGQYKQSIDFYQQSLEVFHKVGDHNGEASSLNDLGNIYARNGECQRAIDVLQQALEIYRNIGDHDGEASSLGNLGIAYHSLGRYSQALEGFQKALNLFHKGGNRSGEANALFNIADTLARLGQPWEALQRYQQARQIYQLVGLEHRVKVCDAAIYQLNQIIPAQQSIRAPRIGDAPLPERPSRNEMISSRPPSSRRTRRSKRLVWVYGLLGVAIVLLIWWLKR